MLRLVLVSILTLYLIQGSECYSVARMKRHTEELRDHLVGKISSASDKMETALKFAKATNYGGMLGSWDDCKTFIKGLGKGETVILYSTVFATQVVSNFTEGITNLMDCLSTNVFGIVDCVFDKVQALRQMGLDTKTNAVAYGKNVTTVFAEIKDEFLKCSGHPPTTTTTTTTTTTKPTTTSTPTTTTTPTTTAPTTTSTLPPAPTSTAPPASTSTAPPAPTPSSKPKQVKGSHDLLFKMFNRRRTHK